MIGLRIFVSICPFILVSPASKVEVDTGKSVVWGPGLSPEDLVFPARYFFVQLYDKENNKLTKSVQGDLDVHISGDTVPGPCRVWSNILDRKDGSYIVRYKVYSTCNNLKIDLRYNNEPIQGFPKTFSGTVYSEDCVCPQDMNTWLKDMECKDSYDQIDHDLQNFQNVDFDDIHNKITRKFDRPGSVSLCHYIVKDNEIYRKCYGEYVGFKVFMDAILQSLARKVSLPDLELFVNLGDWPLERKNPRPYPIFSWCGSETTSDIVMPTYDLTEATLECMGRVLLDMLSVQGNTGPGWPEKIRKGFWRGRDSRQERLDLIDLSRKFPDLLNASLTNFFFFRDKESQYGPKVDHISFFDFFQYKYQVTLDGSVAAYRLPYLLAGDSVVLKQDSPYFEHFYRDLIPDVHYVPFKRDLSDLIDKIKWLIDNDEEAQKISLQGRQFARENLMPKDIFCYYAVLLKEWSFKLKNKPQVLDYMEHVPQPQSQWPCECHRSLPKDEL